VARKEGDELMSVTSFTEAVALTNGLPSTPAAPGSYFGYGLNAAKTASTGPRIYAGVGNPNGVLIAPVGSGWLDSSSGGAWYRNVDGTGLWAVVASGSGGNAPGSEYVIRPGTPGNGVNVFETWTECYAALTPGGVPLPFPVNIIFDHDLIHPTAIPIPGNQNYTLPKGTWFSGISFSSQTLIEFQDGATLNAADGTLNGLWLDQSLHIHTVSSVPVITATSPDPLQLIMFRGAEIHAHATAPFVSFQNSAPNQQLVVLHEGASMGTGATPCVEIAGAAGNSLAILIGFFGNVAADTIKSAVGFPTTIAPAIGSAQFSLVQPNALGGITVAILTSAYNIGYTPTVLADWNGVDPGDVGTALDRIAAVLTPIP
jgi:hypothetical protein